jgi:hypothetical protein
MFIFSVFPTGVLEEEKINYPVNLKVGKENFIISSYLYQPRANHWVVRFFKNSLWYEADDLNEMYVELGQDLPELKTFGALFFYRKKRH